MTPKFTKEVKVGLLALVAGTMLYVGFNFLKGNSFFSATKKYFIIYKNTEGLSASNPIALNGINVGRVSSLTLLTDNNNKILVAVEINNDVQVGDSTVAVLSSASILGGKSIELLIGRNTKVYSGGDTITGSKKEEFSDMLSKKALPILTNLDSTVVKLNKVFGDELGLSVKNTLHNFEITSHDLKETVALSKGNIAGITKNLHSLSTSLNETEKAVGPLIKKMSSFADSLNDMQLKQTVANASAAMKNLNDISNKINHGNGSIGLLINDKSLYQKLDNSAKDLDLLLIDLKKNPKRYVHFSVFGKKDQPSVETPPTP